MLRRRVRYFGSLILVLLAFVRPTSAGQIPAGMRTCAPLADCMKLLDGVAAKANGGIGPEEVEIRGILQKFGEPAKQELLRRAVGNNRGWRNLAGAILEGWGSWFPSDVPALRLGLLKDPGGWSARGLREIGTMDAIRALVEDVPRLDEDNQTVFALVELGAKTIPFLIPLLEEKKTAKSAQRVIGEMDDSALPFAFQWAQIATDASKPTRVRVGALRGVAAFGSRGRSASEKLPPLLSSRDPAIRTEVDATLRTVRNPAVIHEVARACAPRAERFDPMPTDSFLCLSEIAEYGDDGQGAGPELLPFLSSKNGVERAHAITTLAAIGYKSALPQIREALSSPDWRVTYAAVRALGWLGDKEALPDLEKVASNHWLPELRDEATRTMAALRSPEGRLERTGKFFPPDETRDPFEIDRASLGREASCSSHRWVWNGTSFALTWRDEGVPAKRNTSLEFPSGSLHGTDLGEFGGTLTWKDVDRITKPKVIFKDDVIGMEKDGDGAMVLFGLAHMGFEYGYVLRVERSPDNEWNISELARLPGVGEALTTIAPGVFAALSRNRVVVFTRTGILGMATCEDQR
jgi:HEAT repeat protein